jgi:hypothetical protein
MALIDRIFHDDPDSTRSISNHAFSASVWFWAKGDITRAQVVSAFEMTTDDEIQLDELEAHYISLSVDDRRSFHSDLEGAGVLAEQGFITKVQYKSLLGLT